MSLQRQVIYWLIAFLLFLGFVYLFSNILLPFIMGMVVAYILDPVADRIEKWGISRLGATITIVFVCLIVFFIFLLVIIPVIADQLVGFIENIPKYINTLQGLLMSDWVSMISAYLPFELDDLRNNSGTFVEEAVRWLTAVLKSVVNGGQAFLNIISLFVITPVVAFYLLYDWDNMIAKLNDWLPKDHAGTIRKLAQEMSDMIAGFVRGQGMICLLLGIFYAVFLSLTGLKFGLLIGFGIGLISFIPFVGALIGAVISFGVALAQFLPEQNYTMIVAVVVIFMVGQFLEGNVLQPRLLSNYVQLHPVWLMFALFSFGSLYGFVGMLIAVPAAACIGVLVRFGIEHYLESGLYLGQQGKLDNNKDDYDKNDSINT